MIKIGAGQRRKEEQTGFLYFQWSRKKSGENMRLKSLVEKRKARERNEH